MWTRKELKERAKSRFKANYWVCVLVALILGLLVSGSSGGSGAAGRSDKWNNHNDNQMVEDTVMDYLKDDSVDNAAEDFEKAFDEMVSQVPNEAVGIAVVSVLIITIIFFVIVLCVSVFVFNPLIVGCRRFFAKNLVEKAKIEEVGHMFDHGYKSTVKAMFFKELYTFLWSLLFVIPGIVKSYEYRMVPYITAMNPELDTNEIFARSREMMKGNKWNAFVLDLSFIGWNILSVCTFGLVGLFYVAPYMYQTDAALYEALNGGMIENNN